MNGKEREKVLFILSIVTGIALLAGSVMLVNERYRMRQLFVEHERAIDVERRLKDDQAELLMREPHLRLGLRLWACACRRRAHRDSRGCRNEDRRAR